MRRMHESTTGFAFVQLVPGPKIQITIGYAPAMDIKEIPNFEVKEFPVIKLEACNVPFLPFEDDACFFVIGPFQAMKQSRARINQNSHYQDMWLKNLVSSPACHYFQS